MGSADMYIDNPFGDHRRPLKFLLVDLWQRRALMGVLGAILGVWEDILGAWKAILGKMGPCWTF